MTTLQMNILDNQSAPAALRSGQKLFSRISAGTGVIAFLLMIYFAIYTIQRPSGETFYWESLVLAVVFAALLVVAWLSTASVMKNAANQTIHLMTAVQVSMVALAFLVKDAGIPAALISLVFTVMVGFLSLSLQRSGQIVMIGIISAIASYFFTSFSPVEQLSIPAMQINLIALFGLLVMVYLAMLAMEYVVATLGVKLITSALLIALIPLLILSAVQAAASRAALREQSIGSMELAASQTADKIEDFLDQNISNISLYTSYYLYSEFLTLPDEERAGSPQEEVVRAAIKQIDTALDKSYLESIAILDINGKNVIDTESKGLGQLEQRYEYFTAAVGGQRGFISPILFDTDGTSHIVFSSPIYDMNRKVLGVLRVRYRGRILQDIIATSRGILGANSYPVLVDDNGLRIADSSGDNLIYQPITSLSPLKLNDLIISNRLPSGYEESPLAHNPEMEQAINSDEEMPFFTFIPHNRESGIEQAGLVIRLRSAPWNLVYTQEMEVFQTLIEQQSKATTLMVSLFALIVSVAAAVLSRAFSGRILKLTHAAERFTAGDLDVTTEVEESDEIGILGQAFNMMTRQLSTLINELEARVAARTAELSEQNDALVVRSQQLKTVSDVARSIASTNDLETLLNQVTMLVSHRFGFYHAGIFLVDDNREYAYLRASNSEGGRRMLERQHKLKIGEVGIVGYACGVGSARIATDVGQDATYFNNPDLPYTRSEMALPLKSGNEIIGALDVQSIESNAFTEEDVELFSILADQVAIAIVNNRLYAETSQTLEEMQSLHRRYLRSEWSRETETRRHLSYRYTAQGVVAVDEQVQPEVEQVLETGEVFVQAAEDGSEEAALAVPILLRGETIGVIHLQEPGQQKQAWSQEELNSVKTVADQIALALENARLFEQTTRRAERERKVLEITSKIRSTNDFQTMLKVAVEELQTALNASRTQVVLQGAGEEAASDAPRNNNGHK